MMIAWDIAGLTITDKQIIWVVNHSQYESGTDIVCCDGSVSGIVVLFGFLHITVTARSRVIHLLKPAESNSVVRNGSLTDQQPSTPAR